MFGDEKKTVEVHLIYKPLFTTWFLILYNIQIRFFDKFITTFFFS